MKRIFISVGSQGTKALAQLIDNLNMENMFNCFQDYYIAFDTDDRNVKWFEQKGISLNTDRVKAYNVVITNDDAVVASFRDTAIWQLKGVFPGGVGGRRAISKKAASIIRTVWNDPHLGLNNNLSTDDQIIVVGSAFGGTSGGMFLNVCQYLDYIISKKMEGTHDFQNVEVRGFLLMPDSNEIADYATIANMLDMFRELQTVSWQRRLETARPGFKVPVFCQYNPANDNFPLYHGVNNINNRGIFGSSLPMSTLYLVPTIDGAQNLSTELYTETLFAATYLNICPGKGEWTNRANNAEGPHKGIDLLHVEDNCISGFNMFAMKSGRSRTLKNWFYKGILSAISDNAGANGLLAAHTTDETTCNEIEMFFYEVQTPGKDVAPYAGIPNTPHSPLANLLNDLENINTKRAFTDFKNNCINQLEAIRRTAPVWDILNPKELIAKLGCSQRDWLPQINFALIKEAYNKFYNTLSKNNSNHYLTKIEGTFDEAERLIRKRCSSRVISDKWYGLSQENAVFREIISSFNAAFRTYLKHYLFACRCERTTFVSVDTFNSDVDNLIKECNGIKNTLENKRNQFTNNNNHYIVQGQLVDNLTLDDVIEEVNFKPFEILMSALCCNYNGNNADGDTNSIIEKESEKVIANVLQATAPLPDAANPLAAATIANFNAMIHKTHAPQMAVNDSCNYHMHFAIKYGNVPPTFSMTNNDVVNALRLTTMPGCVNGGTDFWACPHNATTIADSWRGNGNQTFKPFDGKHINMQGLWVGTLGIDFKVREILNKIYNHVPTKKEEWNTWDGSTAENIMTTVEMVKFGLIIEVIGNKFQKAWAHYKHVNGTPDAKIAGCLNTLSISFQNASGGIFKLPEDTPSNLGFSDAVPFPVMTSIKATWVKDILDWIRSQNPVNGFSAFFPGIKFDSISNTEKYIFTDMRFSITNAEQTDMDKAKTTIENSMNMVI